MSAAVLSPALMIMPSGYEEHANDFQMLDAASSNDESEAFSTGSPVDEDEDCTSIDDGIDDDDTNNNDIISNKNPASSDDMSLPSLSDVPLFGNIDDEEEEEPVIDNNNDNNDDDNDVDNWLTSMEITTETEEETTTTEAETTTNNNNNTNSINYGGLYNMGNTCYMNSALQMLASCEELQEKLLQHEPQNETALELYTEVKELLTKLKNGETISPTKFKQILDNKSPLFLGYRQQDSHEFLTTLIDLLDEDYLKKVEEDKEESKEKEEEENKEEEEDFKMDITTTTVEEEEEKKEEEEEVDTEQEQLEEELVQDMMTEENENDQQQQEEEVVVEEEKQPLLVAAPQSPTRRASLPSSPEAPTRRKIRGLPETVASPMRKIQSYSDLQPNDIEYLLHGSNNNDKKRSSETLSSSSSSSSPQCKLVGGRAILTNNTTYCCPSDVVVEDDGNNNDVSAVARLPEEANNESQDNQEEQEKEEEEEAKPYSPIDELFTTEIRVCLTCDSCKYTRSHNETYKHLSLEIGDDNSTSTNSSVEEGLRNFFKDEKRDIKCEKCFGETATQTMKIVKVPRYFLIHLKRFIVNYSADWSSVTYRKNQSSVDFTTELSITDNNSTSSSVLGEYLADDVSIPLVNNTNTSTTTSPCCDNNNDNNDTTSTPTYSIRSIVNHIGSSASCGHYTADSLRLLQQKQQQQDDNDDDASSSSSSEDDECKCREWLRFNDSNVSRINNNDALTGHSKRTAYMIMYELV